jgi:hypothetical protein
MSKIVALGAVSEVTKAQYFAGTDPDGIKAQNPQGAWVFMKATPGTRVDTAPEF